MFTCSLAYKMQYIIILNLTNKIHTSVSKLEIEHEYEYIFLLVAFNIYMIVLFLFFFKRGLLRPVDIPT